MVDSNSGGLHCWSLWYYKSMDRKTKEEEINKIIKSLKMYIELENLQYDKYTPHSMRFQASYPKSGFRQNKPKIPKITVKR